MNKKIKHVELDFLTMATAGKQTQEFKNKDLTKRIYKRY